MEICESCGKEHDRIFRNNNKKSSRFCSRKCYSKEYKKKYNITHKEQIKFRRAKYYQLNKDQLKISVQSYREETDYGKKYYYNNINKEKLRIKEYRKTENGKISMKRYRKLRYARLNNIIELFTIEEWLHKVNKTEGVCPLCGVNVGVECLTLDHILPISKVEYGHTYTINDVEPLCRSCNSTKGAKIGGC